jgi:hypothetical protein
MGFVNDPDVQVESGEQLLLALQMYADGLPRIVVLHSDEFGTLQIGIGGPWGGLAYFTETHTDMVVPTEPAKGEYVDFLYYGQPCSVAPNEVFDTGALIRIVHHIFMFHAFPPEVTLRPM